MQGGSFYWEINSVVWTPALLRIIKPCDHHHLHLNFQGWFWTCKANPDCSEKTRGIISRSTTCYYLDHSFDIWSTTSLQYVDASGDSFNTDLLFGSKFLILSTFSNVCKALDVEWIYIYVWNKKGLHKDTVATATKHS